MSPGRKRNENMREKKKIPSSGERRFIEIDSLAVAVSHFQSGRPFQSCVALNHDPLATRWRPVEVRSTAGCCTAASDQRLGRTQISLSRWKHLMINNIYRAAVASRVLRSRLRNFRERKKEPNTMTTTHFNQRFVSAVSLVKLSRSWKLSAESDTSR